MQAMKPINMRAESFRSEARYIADRRGMNPTAEQLMEIEFALMHRAFIEKITPYLLAKNRVTRFAIPIRQFNTSTQELKIVDDGLTDAMKEALAELDKLIYAVRKEIYGDLLPEDELDFHSYPKI